MGSWMKSSSWSLAEVIGHVVLETTLLDYWACHLIASKLGGSDEAWRRYWGQSGRQLVDGLREAANYDERVAKAVDPYRSIVDRRNQVVHGLWFQDGERPGLHEAVRPLQHTDGESDDRMLSLEDLRKLRSDIKKVSDYVSVLYGEYVPLRQYGTGELLPRPVIRLPSLEGVDLPVD